MTGSILLVIGAVALFAAIVGGGVKIRDIEVGDVKSLWRQGMLAAFGIVVALVGLLVMMGVFDPDTNSSANTVTNSVENTDQNDTTVQPAANDANTVDENSSNAPADTSNTETTMDNSSDGQAAQQ